MEVYKVESSERFVAMIERQSEAAAMRRFVGILINELYSVFAMATSISLTGPPPWLPSVITLNAENTTQDL